MQALKLLSEFRWGVVFGELPIPIVICFNL